MDTLGTDIINPADAAREQSQHALSVLPKPEPREAIVIRDATLDDLDAIDALQKQASDALGFLTLGAITGYVENPNLNVLVAEVREQKSEISSDSSLTSDLRPLIAGYIIGRDSYYSNEQCGYITQVNIHPEHRRSLIGAKLVEALFERAAYGCRLYACWCAQDLPANRFWESIGFVPIAFRTGSANSRRRKKKSEGDGACDARIHIFWQKRIREGDEGPSSGGTPYWFPSKTRGGQIGADRVALPIPPGTHWSDAKPTIIPGVANVPMFLEGEVSDEQQRLLEDADAQIKRAKAQEQQAQEQVKQRRSRRAGGRLATSKRRLASSGGLRYPSPEEIAAEKTAEQAREQRDAAKQVKKQTRKQIKRKYHPQFLAAAREFRDRFLESASAEGGEMLIAEPAGKYDVTRQLQGGGGLEALLHSEAGAGMTTHTALPGADGCDDSGDVIDAEFEARDAA